MLFHSTTFLFYLLPATFFGWLLFAACGRMQAALGWLTGCSLVFYAYWNPPYLALLIGSILFNFVFGKLVDPALRRPEHTRFLLLSFGVCANLLLLGYFKYANFFVDTINQVFQAGWTFEKVLLPLAISFFTFQQIAYLVDSFRGQARGHSFLDYTFFVSFFPQLIAGPIVHHSEILRQLREKFLLSRVPFYVVFGLSIFAIGLFKKMVLADSCGELATPFFGAVAEGQTVTTSQSWCGVLAYTFQIYFDFSGYSDMAIGLGLLFGLRLPENFAAPYRATNIIEFWRRWHITLSRFLRDYLYIPLGGNRRGVLFRYRNLFITMVLGGLWHGAGWTFLIWGALHGIYLVINHGWNHLLQRQPRFAMLANSRAGMAGGWLITMLAVVVAWVFFRADSLASSQIVLQSMAGFSSGGEAPFNPASGFWITPLAWPFLVFLALICLFAPTTQTYFAIFLPTLQSQPVDRPRFWQWKPGILHGFIVGMLLLFVIKKYHSLAPTEFLYFNF